MYLFTFLETGNLILGIVQVRGVRCIPESSYSLTYSKSSAIRLLSPSPPFPSSLPPPWLKPLSLTWMTAAEPCKNPFFTLKSECSSYNITLMWVSHIAFLLSPSLLCPHLPVFMSFFLFLKYTVFVMASSTHMTLFVFLSPYLMPTLTSHLHLSPISSGCPPSPLPPDYTHPESDGPAICHKITKYSSFSRHGSFNFLTRKHQWEQSPCSPWHSRHLPLGWAIQITCSMSECIFLHLFFNFHPASFSFLKPRILSSFMLFLPTYFLEMFLSSNSLSF